MALATIGHPSNGPSVSGQALGPPTGSQPPQPLDWHQYPDRNNLKKERNLDLFRSYLYYFLIGYNNFVEVFLLGKIAELLATYNMTYF